MGLDNGIEIKNYKEMGIVYPSFIVASADFPEEICYWRKCWGIRNAIMAIIHGDDNVGGEVCLENLPLIIDELKRFAYKEVWETEGRSIWSYEDFMEYQYGKSLCNLSWLYEYWKCHPELKVYFYDSY